MVDCKCQAVGRVHGAKGGERHIIIPEDREPLAIMCCCSRHCWMQSLDLTGSVWSIIEMQLMLCWYLTYCCILFGQLGGVNKRGIGLWSRNKKNHQECPVPYQCRSQHSFALSRSFTSKLNEMQEKISGVCSICLPCLFYCLSFHIYVFHKYICLIQVCRLICFLWRGCRIFRDSLVFVDVSL